MRRCRCTLLALGGSWWVGVAGAQEAPPAPPDLDFLEYLGAWAAEDDEWLAIEEWHKGNPGEAEDADEGDAEQDDEDDESE